MAFDTAAGGRARRLSLFDTRSAPMRAFHLSWLAFFLTFFGWFGLAPLMAVVREDLHLTKAQIGNLIIASVAVTTLSRIAVGWVLDRLGPRRTYALLLFFGAWPVMLVGLSHNYVTFLVFRLLIGAIGASFVITSYHTSIMFAPNVVGLANATAAGWGNFGGGVTQLAMPLIFSALLGLGLAPHVGWRVAMIVPGALMLVMSFAYYRLTQDSPDGDFLELRRAGRLSPPAKGSLLKAAADWRTWGLAAAYAGSFGVELTMDNVAALYFHDRFALSVTRAGLVVAIYASLNLFARALGGGLSDRLARGLGLAGRVRLLTVLLMAEGAGLMLFSRMSLVPLALAAMMLFGLFMKMSEGACFAIVPFVNRETLGSIAGLVGAGGNVGAVLFGLLFRGSLSTPQAIAVVGVAAMGCGLLAGTVRFSTAAEYDERRALDEALWVAPRLADLSLEAA